jgi:hypothetical protein
MIRPSVVTLTALACLGACTSSEPDESAKGSAQGSLGAPDSDRASDDRPTGHSVDVEIGAPPPLPAWWFDEPIWTDGRLSICLQATRETNALAGEAITQALYDQILGAFGETPVDVGVTQDITLLEGGGVRIAALFDIAPKHAADAEDPDG